MFGIPEGESLTLKELIPDVSTEELRKRAAMEICQTIRKEVREGLEKVVHARERDIHLIKSEGKFTLMDKFTMLKGIGGFICKDIVDKYSLIWKKVANGGYHSFVYNIPTLDRQIATQVFAEGMTRYHNLAEDVLINSANSVLNPRPCYINLSDVEVKEIQARIRTMFLLRYKEFKNHYRDLRTCCTTASYLLPCPYTPDDVLNEIKDIIRQSPGICDLHLGSPVKWMLQKIQPERLSKEEHIELYFRYLTPIGNQLTPEVLNKEVLLDGFQISTNILNKETPLEVVLSLLHLWFSAKLYSRITEVMQSDVFRNFLLTYLPDLFEQPVEDTIDKAFTVDKAFEELAVVTQDV